MPGWNVLGSFFEYGVERYNTDFGIAAAQDVPQLFFNVSLRRQFIGPLIANLLPVAVTAAMLFGMLLITTKTETQVVKAMDIVRGTAALFVVASFQHIGLRNALSSPRVFYFEYFYFVLMSLLVSTACAAVGVSDVFYTRKKSGTSEAAADRPVADSPAVPAPEPPIEEVAAQPSVVSRAEVPEPVLVARVAKGFA